MKKIAFGFALALCVFSGIAAMLVHDRGILIRSGFGGEPKLKAVQPDQTANWIEFDNFQLPSTGIIPVAYGGTGKADAGLTTNISFIFSADTTNTLYFTNGIVYRATSP